MSSTIDILDKIFQDFRLVSDSSKSLVTIATAFGFAIFLFVSLRFTFKIVQGLWLYVISQYCCKVDFRRRYGQWAVISGSTDGIGLAFARELARRGMSIIVIGRNEHKLANTKSSLEREPNVGEVVTIKIDLSDSSLANFESIREQMDPDNRDIGILINNAGTHPDKVQRFARHDMGAIVAMVNLNISCALHLTRMILPAMVTRGRGLVVNVSSIAGFISTPYSAVYGPSKSFVNSFTRQLQAEYSGHPVDIVNLTPGPVCTSLLTRVTRVSAASVLAPTADYYARSALNAISARCSRDMSGTITHAITRQLASSFRSLGPVVWKLFGRFAAKHLELSPVARRREARFCS